MEHKAYPPGSVRALLNSMFVSPATRDALAPRLAAEADAPPRFFDQKTFETLRAVCARLVHLQGSADQPNPAHAIDRRLADGECDGWRYDSLPPDGAAYTRGLSELEARAQALFGNAFAAIDQQAQDSVLEASQRGEGHDEWAAPARRWFEELLAECVEIYYSHPLAQEEIGYVGMADQPGWQRIGLNEREPWEPALGVAYELPPAPPAPPEPPEPTQPPPMRQYRTDEIVDAVVIGTGAGGAPLLARLAAAGLSVVALEAGRHWEPQREFATDERAQAGLFWNDERLSGGNDPVAFGRNNSGIGVGGTTLHYTAYTPRAQPDDFQLHTESGVGANWPLGYAELEPYYDELESLLGVSGPAPYPWGPARRRGYPLPPLPLNGAAQLMQRGCAALGIRTSPAANAALSAPYYQPGIGWRAACTNRGFCQAGCSIGAKASTDVTFIPLALAAGAELRSDCFVTKLETDNTGRICAVVYTHNGVERRQHCRTLFLCAGAIETPRLLLLNGLANTSGQVGRNFMAHVGVQLWGQFADDVRPNKGIPGALISEETHRVPGGGFAGGYLLQSIGVMPVTYASQLARGQGTWGAALREHMRGYNNVAGINVLGECLPAATNYMELSDERDARGLPKPRVYFSAGANERAMTAHAEGLMREIWGAAGAQNLWAFPRYAHTIGTCRMGSDAGSAVVDRDGRSFEIPNLYICDNSIFPSALSVNPALTIMALSLRIADQYIARLRRHAA